MKNLFKNKKFYLGLVTAFAIAAGVYYTYPTAASVEPKEATSSGELETINDSQPASNSVTTPVPSVNTVVEDKSDQAPKTEVQPSEGTNAAQPENTGDQI